MDRRSNLTQPFAFFRCPRCGHFQRHASILMKGWHSYNWCGACSSYFRVKHEFAVLVIWGLIFGILSLGVFWAGTFLSGDLWKSGAWMLFAELIGGVVSIPLARRLVKFEYVGRDAP
jgi:hypothetical protein